jgi:hypothetical protein
MTKLFFFTFSVTLLFINADCKKDIVDPPVVNTDTTSHNFTWQTFTWGGGGASSINDIAIISDTNIWAVGEIHFPRDSNGQIIPFYNIIRWNGQGWTFDRVYYEYQGQQYLARFTSIFAFSPNDIWIGSNQPMHWNGSTWQQFDVPGTVFSGYVNRFWGTSSSNLYMVGNQGAMAYYNGSSWQKVESGTTLDFFDIYGDKNLETCEYEILAIAASAFQAPARTELYRIQGTTLTKIFSRDDAFTTVWFKPNEKYYFGGNGIAWKNSLNDTAWNQYPYFQYTKYFISKIRGTGLNDIFSVGSFMEVAHYNGSTWYNYSNEIPIGDGGFGTLITRDNYVVMGGQLGQHALLLIGKR